MIRYIVLAALLAVIYAQTESEPVSQGPHQTLEAPAAPSEIALKSKVVSGEVVEVKSRDKRAPIIGKALLGAGALGAGVLGAKVLGAGVLGAGALGAGVLGAKAFGAGLYKAK